MVDAGSSALRLGRSLILSAVLAVGLLGCGDDSSPGKDLQVSNAQDSFQFQVTDTQNYSHTYTYAWANAGASASVNQACSITSGDATLVIQDANGTTVYAKSLKQNGTYNSSSGVAGTWTIQVMLSKTSGTLNFRAQKL
jgi:hypothetical protein